MKHLMIALAAAAATGLGLQAQTPFTLPSTAQAYMRPDADISGGIDHIGPESSYYCYSATRMNTPDLAGKYIIAMEIDGFRDDDGTAWKTSMFSNLYCNIFGVEFPQKSWENIGFSRAGIGPDGKLYATFPDGVAVPEGDFGIGFFNDMGAGCPAKYTPVCKNNKGAQNGIWTRVLRGSWADMSASFGPMPVKFYYVNSKDEVPATVTSLALSAPKRVNPVGEGTSFVVKLPVKNTGWVHVDDITYNVTVDGQDVTSGAELDAYTVWLGVGLEEECPFTIPGISGNGSHTVTVTATQANYADLSNPASVTFNVTVQADAPQMPEGAIEAGYTNGIASDSWGTQINHVDACSKFDDANLLGLQIVGAKVEGLRQGGLDNFSIWHSSTLGGAIDEEVACVQYGGTVTALFAKPVTITADGPFVGCTFDIIDGSIWAVPVGGKSGIANSCFIKNASGEWEDFSCYGALTVTLFVKGDVPAASMAVKKHTGNTIFEAGKPFDMNFEVVNYGNQPISSLTYQYTIGDQTGSKTVSLANPVPVRLCATTSTVIPFDGLMLDGLNQATITVTAVNGQANACENNSATANLRFTKFLPEKRPLFEEMTGTGCGWCPRGMLGMAKLADTYPEYIGAAWHQFNSSDPMYVPHKAPFSNSSAPNAKLDRGSDIDPYYGVGSQPMGIIDAYEKAAALKTPVQIELNSQFDANKENLNVNAITSFSYTEEGQRYKIGYLLVENQLTGTGNAWSQANYYSGKDDDPADSLINLLNKSVNQGGFDISKFDHVVIDGSASQGLDNSLIKVVTPYHKYGSEYSFNLKDNEITQNPENLRVIAFVLDMSGKVRNAVEVKAGEASVTPFPEADPEETGGETETEIDYNPNVNNIRYTGGELEVGGERRYAAIALNDSIMALYAGYEAVGVKAFAFKEGEDTKYQDLKIFTIPYKIGSTMYTDTIWSKATMVDVIVQNQMAIGRFEKAIPLEEGNPMFGFIIGTNISENINTPFAYDKTVPAPKGAYYFSNFDEWRMQENSKAGRLLISVLARKKGTTEMVEIPVSGQNMPVYYDLAGRRIDRPSHGVYIRVFNGKAEKVVY